MDSSIETADDWISKFRNVQSFDQSVIDATSGATSGKQDLCYTIAKTSDNTTKQLTFNSNDCFTMALPICFIERTNFNLGLPLPRFPCVTTQQTQQPLSRRRRNTRKKEDDDVQFRSKESNNGRSTNIYVWHMILAL